MKTKYVLIAIAFTLISCVKEISPIDKNNKPIVFKVSVNEETKASSKTNWVEGDVVYVVFKGITTKYLQLIRDENEPDGWRKVGQNTSFTASDFSGIAEADKKLTAVYFPVSTNASLSGGVLSFTTATGGCYNAGIHVFTYYLKATDTGYTTIEDAENVIININISLSIPDGFVQFHVPGIPSSDVDNYRFSTTWLQPTACSSISTIDGSIDEYSLVAGSPLPMGFADSDGAIFSGKMKNQASITRNFVIRSGGEKYIFSKERVIESGHFYKFKALNDAMWTHTTGEYEYVDLGLSVMWASWNMGASAPEENGSLYSWGETFAKSQYDMSEYMWYVGGTMAKYNMTDAKTSLDPEDDAANIRLGGKWRIPTKDEFNELCNNCKKENATVNGVTGRRFTSKIAGYTDKSIFLPLAGYNQYRSRDYAGSMGYYWSSTRDESAQHCAWALWIALSQDRVQNDEYRYIGYSIRPVVDY